MRDEASREGKGTYYHEDMLDYKERMKSLLLIGHLVFCSTALFGNQHSSVAL
jgi:hypothetical protein